MLILYVLAALLAAVLIAFFVMRARSRRAQQAGSPPGTDASGPINARADLPGAASRKEEADATMVYKRASRTAAAAAPLKREGASPGVLTGARLVGLSGHHKGHHFPVGATGLAVGRSGSCDIVLVDERVSSHHAWIGMVNGKAMLRDLKSTNGTFLNTQTRVSVGETELRPGDTIFFGGHQGDQFRFLAD